MFDACLRKYSNEINIEELGDKIRCEDYLHRVQHSPPPPRKRLLKNQIKHRIQSS